MKIKTSKVFNATKNDLFNNFTNDKECKNPYTFFIENGNYITTPKEIGFISEEEAEKARKEITNKDYNKIIFLVLKNADFTEGRGPMIPIKAFNQGNKAHEFIMQQSGIYGSTQKLKISFGVNIHGGLYSIINYNGYEIKEFILE